MHSNKNDILGVVFSRLTRPYILLHYYNTTSALYNIILRITFVIWCAFYVLDEMHFRIQLVWALKLQLESTECVFAGTILLKWMKTNVFFTITLLIFQRKLLFKLSPYPKRCLIICKCQLYFNITFLIFKTVKIIWTLCITGFYSVHVLWIDYKPSGPNIHIHVWNGIFWVILGHLHWEILNPHRIFRTLY
jgi:hypothetical protein